MEDFKKKTTVIAIWATIIAVTLWLIADIFEKKFTIFTLAQIVILVIAVAYLINFKKNN